MLLPVQDGQVGRVSFVPKASNCPGQWHPLKMMLHLHLFHCMDYVSTTKIVQPSLSNIRREQRY